MSKWLYAIHDEGGEHLMADKPGWIVITEAVGSDPNDQSGRDYRHLSSRGFSVIVRLNNGYYPAGSIPTASAYRAFAERCANFVAASPGAGYFVIANEPNHLNEQVPGQPVTPSMYADCFNLCYAAIKAVMPDAQIITAPVAPWDASTKYPGNERGDWVQYFADMLWAIPRCDGIGLHTYTHGAALHLLTSDATMDADGFTHRRFEFRTYLDFLAVVPPNQRRLPVFITETDQNDPWVDANTGWVQGAYAEIDRHNQTPDTQKVACLALYRWKRDDKWEFSSKAGVHADFRAAVGRGYLSPVEKIEQKEIGSRENNVRLPAISSSPISSQPISSQPISTPLPARDWDPRLTQRGVAVETPQLAPGQTFWRVVKARWYDEQEADRLGPDRHIMLDVLGTDGNRLPNMPLRVKWPSDQALIRTEVKPGEPYAVGFGMSASRNEYSVWVDDGKPSERVVGIGMGAETSGGFNAGLHTSTGVVFQLATMPQAAQPMPQPRQPAQVPALAHPVTDPRYRNVTQGWGERPDYYRQFRVDGVALKGHNGLDFGTPIGTVVASVDAGRVVEVANDPAGYGEYIKLVHPWGESLYAHLDAQHVAAGDIVTRGQYIGASGNTGNSTGPHLHFGLRVYPFNRRDGWGGFVDPSPYLIAKGGPEAINTGAPLPITTREQLVTLIKAAAQEFRVEWQLLASLAWAESSFNPGTVSAAGAKGLTQIMDATWREWAAKVGASDPLNARDNLRVGAAYLAWLQQQTGGNAYKALHAYVWGIGNVLSGGTPPDEVYDYADKIVHGRDLLKAVSA